MINLAIEKDINMGFNFEKLNELATDRSTTVIKKSEELEKNRDWLRMSRMIALAIRYYLRKADIKQNTFAEMLGVSPAYVGKLLKGNENLTLETISRIQKIIGEELITIWRPYENKTTILPYNLKKCYFGEKKGKYKSTINVNTFSSINNAAKYNIA